MNEVPLNTTEMFSSSLALKPIDHSKQRFIDRNIG